MTNVIVVVIIIVAPAQTGHHIYMCIKIKPVSLMIVFPMRSVLT